MKRRDFVRHLITHGCVLVREGRSHTIFENPANGRRSPMPRHRELPDPLVRAICKQLRLPQP